MCYISVMKQGRYGSSMIIGNLVFTFCCREQSKMALDTLMDLGIGVAKETKAVVIECVYMGG